MAQEDGNNAKRPKLIQVIGLGHSGTTLLDAVLGCSPKVVGIGEALRTLDHRIAPNSSTFRNLREGRFQEAVCSCGETVETCPVWRPLQPHLLGSAAPQSVAQNLDKLWHAARDQNPSMEYLLESTPAGIGYSAELSAHFDLRLVFIVRDVRSWGASQARRRKVPMHRAYAKWLAQVPELQRRIEASGLPCFRLGYEELALAPAKALGKLCDWLGIAYTDEMLTPGAFSGSHIANGNVAMLKGDRTLSIRYDADWLTHGRLDVRALWLLRRAATINQELVYGNGVLQRPPKK
ncbi:sulfotransferase family protein [Shimia ponticola]|uniref:sulfotransferase family protein n=1 Tax=Shimia ponticola TaxID=2582893 RepID=UPI00164AD2F0|nr:sulfotransferase [Shimia ponticola]